MPVARLQKKKQLRKKQNKIQSLLLKLQKRLKKLQKLSRLLILLQNMQQTRKKNRKLPQILLLLTKLLKKAAKKPLQKHRLSQLNNRLHLHRLNSQNETVTEKQTKSCRGFYCKRELQQTAPFFYAGDINNPPKQVLKNNLTNICILLEK